MKKSLEKIWHERFSRFAERYNEDHLIAGWSRRGLEYRLRNYLEILKYLNISKESKILDLGCGAGTYLKILKQKGHKNLFGVDYSFGVLLKASKKNNHNIYYVNGEGYNLPIKNESIDHIICIGVFQTLERPKLCIQEIYRVLKPKGIVVIDFLNKDELLYKIRKRKLLPLKRFSFQEAINLFSPFFKIKFIKKIYPFTIFSIIKGNKFSKHLTHSFFVVAEK